MSKTKKPDGEIPAKGGKLKLLIGAPVLLAVGAGGAYGAVAAGMIGSGEGAAEVNRPRPVAKGSEDPFAPAAAEKDPIEPVYGEGGSKYRRLYYSFEEGFTSNLADSAGLVQLSLAASTQHDGRVLQWLERHELAIRSAILVELASTPEDDVYSIEGKERLQKRLTLAVNRVLEEQEGFGGVDAIHFRSFLVQ